MTITNTLRRRFGAPLRYLRKMGLMSDIVGWQADLADIRRHGVQMLALEAILEEEISLARAAIARIDAPELKPDPGIGARLGDWLIAHAMRTPYFHLAGYMERFWVVPYISAGTAAADGCGAVNALRRPFARLAQWCGIAVRVHHILRSDDDRAFHDHPWPYVAVVLRGGYFEVRPVYDGSGLHVHDDRVWHGPGAILRRPARSWHRLELPEGKTAWTLFVTGKKTQKWGFMPSPASKVAYDVYLADAERAPATSGPQNEARAAERLLDDLRMVIEDDRHALTFQSLGQYRGAIKQIINQAEK